MLKALAMTLGIASFMALPGMGAVTTYQGSDKACFYGPLASGCTPVSTTTGIGIDTNLGPLLTYTPKSFTTTSASQPIMVDLGTFKIPYTFAGVEGGSFDLNVNFTKPTGSGPAQSYSADTFGLVVATIGGATLSFDQPTVQAFNGFNLSLPSSVITICDGSSYELYGTITPTPEPSFAAGLSIIGAGLAWFSWRRKMAAAKS